MKFKYALLSGGDETETTHKEYTLCNSLYLNEAGEKAKSLRVVEEGVNW